MNPQSILQKLKSAKLWATLCTVGLATFELHAGHLQSADWVRVVEIVLPFWLLSHTAAKAWGAKLASAVAPSAEGK
jgi:hypothetical protein